MNKHVISTVAAAFALSSASALTIVSSDITSDTTWDTDGAPYILQTDTFVKDGATLTINPGVIVRGQPAGADDNPGSLVVTRNGQINADGDRNNPIIFTTAAVDTDGDDVPEGDSTGDNLLRFDDSEHDEDDFYDSDPKNNPLPPLAGTATPGNQAQDENDDNFVPGATGEGLSANNELWGGLILLGNAPTNLGTATGGSSTDIFKEEPLEGFVEGLPNSEDTSYGGRSPNDNSGVLRFVSVRHGGEVLGEANEINGITMGGVGFGTTIENVEVYCTWDDGFEWFGGTVNARNLVVTFAGDDQLDGDQGWTGSVQNAFLVLPYFDIGSGSGDKLFEFDGEDGATSPETNTVEDSDGNELIFPQATYTIANFTGVGPFGAADNTFENTEDDKRGRGSIQLRANWAGTLLNGFIVNTNNDLVADPFASDQEAQLIDSVTIKNVTDNISDDNESNGSVPGSAITVANIVDQGSNGGLVGEDASQQGGLDPRPVTGLGVSGVGSDLELPEPFETTSFRGAFDPDAFELWTTGWTVMNTRGILVD